jgi:hypothetical protein
LMDRVKRQIAQRENPELKAPESKLPAKPGSVLRLPSRSAPFDR